MHFLKRVIKVVKSKEPKNERLKEKDKRRQFAKEKRKIEAQVKKYELKPIHNN